MVLASGSPQRRAILAQLGIEFEVLVSDVEEVGAGLGGGWSAASEGGAEAVVVENALRKARAVAAGRDDGRLVLGADTAVVAGGLVYGKPADEREAEATLRLLSGRSHEVHSGIALIEGDEERTGSARTVVRFRELDEPTLRWYLASGEWRERAGGYAIQGRGAALVEGIEGDYWNVVGLPVGELLRMRPGLLSQAF